MPLKSPVPTKSPCPLVVIKPPFWLKVTVGVPGRKVFGVSPMVAAPVDRTLFAPLRL